MNVHAASAWPDEASFLTRLRARFEAEGFSFTAHPEPGDLPEFLGSYVPDALARKPGQNVVIEIKRTPGSAKGRSVEYIRQLFDGRDGWRLQVFFTGDDPARPTPFPASDAPTILAGLDEVRVLTAGGHRRAAFILAWSNLEAALRLRTDRVDGRLIEPGTLIQTLAMNGLIEPDTERAARSLIDLRNRIVHGDLASEPTAEDVELILSAVDETLSAEAV